MIIYQVINMYMLNMIHSNLLGVFFLINLCLILLLFHHPTRARPCSSSTPPRYQAAHRRLKLRRARPGVPCVVLLCLSACKCASVLGRIPAGSAEPPETRPPTPDTRRPPLQFARVTFSAGWPSAASTSTCPPRVALLAKITLFPT